ncbi:MAG: hypothetical protein K6E30_07130 [Lachnospiraceae bacterium]|nr:hypothetical protein [Lachnospiraceae bacterium]
MGRTANSIRNMAASLSGQLLNNVLRFFCRTVFIHILGKEYLGISSLYANILTILSASELGFSTAVTYSLYKPLAENDTETAAAIMAFFRKVYRVIGALMLAAGLLLLPLLPKLMTGAGDKVNIYLYYLLYLAQTVISYEFFAYKGVLLIADQKRYLYDLGVYAVQIGMNACQIIALFATRSFLIYTLIAVVCDALQNVVTAAAADRNYPYLKEPARKLTEKERCGIFRQVYASSLYRLCSIVGTSTDNLVISSNISVFMVGLYDNYTLIVQVVSRILQGAFQAFASSIGNLYASESPEKNEFIFRCLNLLNTWILVFCSVCFRILFQPFISLWIGEQYLLSDFTLSVIVLNFASLYLQNMVQIYRTAAGLFVYGKLRPLISALLNLLISIILVRYLGVSGVIIGSIASRTLTTWWYDAYVLYRRGFRMQPFGYYRDCFIAIFLIVFTAGLLSYVCRAFSAPSWTNLFVKGFISAVLSNLVLFLAYFRREEFHFLIERGRKLLHSFCRGRI